MERWRAIRKWKGWYEVSNKGRVRSLPRKSRAGFGVAFYKGKILKATIGKNGYASVSLSAPGGKREYRYVHQLVAEAFIGRRPRGKEIRHRDGTRHRNHLSNLSYGTVRENQLDRVKHGRGPTGEKTRGTDNGMARLNITKVRYIRAHFEKTTVALALRFKVSQGAVWCVRAGKTWRHVT